jgi:elongation factor G
LTSNAAAAKEAASIYRKTLLSSDKKHKESDNDIEIDDEEESVDGPVLAGLDVPQPVFFCSIEAPSLSKQNDMEKALEKLQREDPSLQVRI